MAHPENTILKVCIRDYVGEVTHHANFGFNRYSGGFSIMGEILPLCDFLTVLRCPYIFLDPAFFCRFMCVMNDGPYTLI